MLIANISRVQVLNLLPKGGVVAEVGVYVGKFSSEIIRVTRPNVLHLIDHWARDGGPTERHEASMHAAFEHVKSTFNDDIIAGKVAVHRDYSTQAAATFPNEHFDWIYIDAAHDYNSVRADLLAYRDKVKHDGFILGHDFSNCFDPRTFGVIPAVREFVDAEGFYLLLVTNEPNPTYLLGRSGSSSAATLETAVLNFDASPPLSIEYSLLDCFRQVEVTQSNGQKTQMMTFGQCTNRPASTETLDSRLGDGRFVAHTTAETQSAETKEKLSQQEASWDLVASLKDEVLWLRQQLASKDLTIVELAKRKTK